MLIKFLTPIKGVPNHNVLFIFKSEEERYIEIMRGFIVNGRTLSPQGIRYWREKPGIRLPTLQIQQVE